MVERSLCMREVRGSIPRISIFNFFTGFDVEHPLIYHGACRNTHSFIESIRLKIVCVFDPLSPHSVKDSFQQRNN
jgi:hypothetical protein